MTIYLLLLLATAIAAALAVALYRKIFDWRSKGVQVLSLSRGSDHHQSNRQQGFIGTKRRASGSKDRKTVKPGRESKNESKKMTKNPRSDQGLRKPWGW